MFTSNLFFGALTGALSLAALIPNLLKSLSSRGSTNNGNGGKESTRVTSGAGEAKAVVMDYNLLASKAWTAAEEAEIFGLIEEAFGKQGLGIIVISNVPSLVKKRIELLPYGRRFMRLPDKIKAKCEDPRSQYSFGWSLGKENLGGRPDIYKGSYYNNPLVDVPTTDEKIIAQYPESCCANIWPDKKDLPGFEDAFKGLGSLMADVGYLLARRCDAYLKRKYPTASTVTNTEEILRNSKIHKGRLLHYLPLTPTATKDDMWCQWHYDHSLLTGLVSAAYLDEDEADDRKEIPCPSPESGLFIVNSKDNKIVRVSIPRDGLAFQLGQTLQVLSGGILTATSHAVIGLPISHPAAMKTSRNTFALFLEPNWDVVLNTPNSNNATGVKQFKEGMTFGEFSKKTIELYY